MEAYIGRTSADFRYPTNLSLPMILNRYYLRSGIGLASHFGYGESLAFADIAPCDAHIYLFNINSFTKTIIDYTDKQHL